MMDVDLITAGIDVGSMSTIDTIYLDIMAQDRGYVNLY